LSKVNYTTLKNNFKGFLKNIYNKKAKILSSKNQLAESRRKALRISTNLREAKVNKMGLSGEPHFPINLLINHCGELKLEYVVLKFNLCFYL
jgi:hypothetical protein